MAYLFRTRGPHALSEWIDSSLSGRNTQLNNGFRLRNIGFYQNGMTVSAHRTGGVISTGILILLHESEYIKDITSSYPQFFTECKTALDYLSILQHNGFPTRLLDFSENPLIALYMACDKESKNHADIMRITVPKAYFKYYDSDTVSILANIAFAEDNFSIKDFKDINSFKENLDIAEFNRRDDVTKLVHLIRNEKPAFKPSINPKHLNGVILFVKPSSLCE